MSYDDDYGNRSYPGRRAPPPDLTDAAQHAGLGPLDGDTEVNHDTLNHPWGKVVRLHGDGKNVGLVDTEAAPRPFPWAIQARFSLDGVTFGPVVPGTWGGTVTFKFTKSFDVKTGPAVETFVLEAGDAIPICALIARKLNVTVRIDGESVLDLWVQFVVCPTTQIDCGALTPTQQEMPMGYTDLGIARFPAQTATPTVYLANALRAMFTIVNMSAANLYVALSGIVNITPGTEVATIVLPPSVSAAYSVLNFRGAISFRFDADDATGYALVSEGRYDAP